MPYLHWESGTIALVILEAPYSTVVTPRPVMTEPHVSCVADPHPAKCALALPYDGLVLRGPVHLFR